LQTELATKIEDPIARAWGSIQKEALLAGVNVFTKALNDEAKLWLTVKTTLEGLDLYHEANHA